MQKLARFGCLHGSVRNWNHAGQKVDLLFSGPKLAHFGPVYTGPDEFLHGRILYLDRLFTWDRANSVTGWSSVHMGPCKFWDQSRLCHDWLKLLFSANHVAVDGLRQIQNGDSMGKNFTWTDKDINLLLHVVLDYIKKSRRRRWLDHGEKQVRRPYENVFWEVKRKGQIPPRFRRTKLQRRTHSKQIQLKKDQENGKVAERRQLQLQK